MRQVVTSAPTREEAIKKALSELSVEMYEVDDIKILDEGSRGLFGLGARPVKVQVTVTKDLERPARNPERPQRDRNNEPRREENRGGGRDDNNRNRERGPKPERGDKPARPEKPAQQERKPERQPNPARDAAPKQEQAPRENKPQRERGERGGRDRNERGGNRERGNDRPQQQATSKPREERKRDERPPRREQPPREHQAPRAERPSHTEDKAAFAQISDEHGHQAAALLAEIIAAMGIQAEVAFKRDPESAARLEVKSEDGALLIGRKGATLGALQYLINRMISQSEDGESLERVVVDVEGYLDRRRESLEDLARSMAAKACETGRSMRLKPMSPQERRIIHVTLQEDPNVRTYSQGEALYRSVVISPSAEGAVSIKTGGGNYGEKRDGDRPNQDGTQPNAGKRPLRNGRRIRPRGGRRNETDVDAGAFGD